MYIEIGMSSIKDKKSEEANTNLFGMYSKDEIDEMKQKFEIFDIDEDGGLATTELKRRKNYNECIYLKDSGNMTIKSDTRRFHSHILFIHC